MTCTLGKESGYYCKCKLKHLEDLTQGNNMIKFYIFKNHLGCCTEKMLIRFKNSLEAIIVFQAWTRCGRECKKQVCFRSRTNLWIGLVMEIREKN